MNLLSQVKLHQLFPGQVHGQTQNQTRVQSIPAAPEVVGDEVLELEELVENRATNNQEAHKQTERRRQEVDELKRRQEEVVEMMIRENEESEMRVLRKSKERVEGLRRENQEREEKIEKEGKEDAVIRGRKSLLAISSTAESRRSERTTESGKLSRSQVFPWLVDWYASQ